MRDHVEQRGHWYTPELLSLKRSADALPEVKAYIELVMESVAREKPKRAEQKKSGRKVERQPAAKV